MGDLTDAFDESVEANRLVKPVDSALVAAGRTMAERIDDVMATGEGQEVTKALYLMPHLMNILKEMGATPASRGEVAATPTQKGGAGGKLGQLKSIAGGKPA